MLRRWPIAVAATLLLGGIAHGEELRYTQGYLLIDADIGRKTVNWKLNDEFAIDELPIGRTLRLVKLEKGKYQWQQISVPFFDLPHLLDVSDDSRWAFTIEGGRVNYVGTLIVGEVRETDNVDVRFVNRLSEVLDRFEAEFPEEAAQYELAYSGRHRDDFLNDYLASDDAP
ncbi:MAG: hypothetical protein AAFZ58_12250 [Pseudomonadota bacterium]